MLKLLAIKDIEWLKVPELNTDYLVCLRGQAFHHFKQPHLYAEVLDELVSRAKIGRLRRDLRAITKLL